MTRIKKRRGLVAAGSLGLIAGLLALAPGGPANADAQDAAVSQAAEVESIFNVMAEVLPGTWHGAFANGTADNPTSDWTETSVVYELTAGGTAIIENYVNSKGQPYMTTVYHQDNNDLRATHFCGARNHPRMIARRISQEEKTVEFDFVDVANLKSMDNYHSRGLSLEILSDDSIVVTYTGLENGSKSTRAFAFRKDAD